MRGFGHRFTTSIPNHKLNLPTEFTQSTRLICDWLITGIARHENITYLCSFLFCYFKKKNTLFHHFFSFFPIFETLRVCLLFSKKNRHITFFFHLMQRSRLQKKIKNNPQTFILQRVISKHTETLFLTQVLFRVRSPIQSAYNRRKYNYQKVICVFPFHYRK